MCNLSLKLWPWKNPPISYRGRTLQWGQCRSVTRSSAGGNPVHCSLNKWTTQQYSLLGCSTSVDLCWKPRSWSMETIYHTQLILLCFSRMFPQLCQQWFWPKMSKIHHRNNCISFNIGTVCALCVHGTWYSSGSARALLAASSDVSPLLQPKCQQNIKLLIAPQTLYPFSLCDI